MKRVIIGLLLVALSVSAAPKSAPPAAGDPRAQAERKMRDGNYKDAYEMFRVLSLDPKVDPKKVGQDLNNAVSCLSNLGRWSEIDEFREKVIETHAGNWRLLQTAAQSYMGHPHYGFIVAGKFERGDRRNVSGTTDGRYVSSFERDRTRALQLMQQAMEKLKADQKNVDNSEAGQFYFSFADMLLTRHWGMNAWRLQYLTDLDKLPDYEEGYYGYGYSSNTRGAPVDDKGNPVYHQQPKSWKDSQSDGERWRWCLAEASELSADLAIRAKLSFAEFLHGQFGVQTMRQHSYFGRGFEQAEAEDDTKKDESGPYAVFTLGEDETIARLASGIKRFKLPDEFNFIKIYQQVADLQKASSWGEQALSQLTGIFSNRQQYPRAAEYIKRNIAEHGDPHGHKKTQLDQIVGNWGMFEMTNTQPAGTAATFDFRFRNGNKVSFIASEIDIHKLLADVKAYLKSNPNQIQWEKIQVENLPYRLLEKNQKQYIGKEAASWNVDLEPRPKHFDKRITVKTPLKVAGAYLVKGQMADGNSTWTIVWIADSVIVRKPLADGSYYHFVADASSGAPIPNAKLDFFGWQQRHIRDRQYEVITREFAENADKDGQVTVRKPDANNSFQWLITSTADGHFAWWGFTGMYSHGRSYDYEYNQPKALVITDRPVYRPYNVVKFKAWLNTAKYDQEGPSPFANQAWWIRILNPKGDKVLEKQFTCDNYGGFDGEFQLDQQATLGVYSLQIWKTLDVSHFSGAIGGQTFRVEEYKKPEFEVKIDAPEEPVMLGEKISATITAKYYFGAPVTQGKVKFKVLRSEHEANWYPTAYWDWMYQPGYWWFAYDYPWYPGWGEWGCKMPYRWWWGHRYQQPEVVLESEMPLAEDGKIKVEIDTALAKAIRGDSDHKYDISAEVTDQSRRTITGSGSVLVARKAFKVYAWVDRGHYRTGEAINASFNAQTLDHKPVKGKGQLKLIKIAYDKDGKPIENVVENWDLDTSGQGTAKQQIKAAQPGQYRLSYTVTDDKKHAIEGGYVFVVRGEGFDGKEFRFSDIELVPDKKEYSVEDRVKLMINTEQKDSTIVLFVRPANGIYTEPKLIRLAGKSLVEEIEVIKKDMPNFFVEAFTVSGGKVFNETKEIVVPPEKRVLNVEVKASAEKYKPGEKAKVNIRLTDPQGQPFEGSTVISIYDKAVEYISGGSNVPEIKSFFWKWRRSHYPRIEHTLVRYGHNFAPSGTTTMQFLGVFGYAAADYGRKRDGEKAGGEGGFSGQRGLARNGAAKAAGGEFAEGARALAAPAAPGAMADGPAPSEEMSKDRLGAPGAKPNAEPNAPGAEPMIRKNFADTALWVGKLNTNKNGEAEVELLMPENLTTWKARVWAMGMGAKVGEGTAEVITTKNLIIRLQAPRFFVQKDEVILSANVHNYLKTKKKVTVSLELEGNTLEPVRDVKTSKAGYVTRMVEVEANGEQRVDWTVGVIKEGTAIVRMKAVTDEESDAMQMSFPVYIHGMLKTESWSGAIRPDQNAASLVVNVPKERKPEQTRLEIRYSPSVALAMVDALPYLVEYPYGCTEQTLNRFVPTVITQKILLENKFDLKAIQEKRTNLNAQEIGDDVERAKQWKHWQRNPVFDTDEVAKMVRSGVDKLAGMQLTDGGWGWFSGYGEQSYPHTTAVVVHGFQVAKANDAAIPASVLERGIEWLKKYQAEEVRRLKLPPTAPYHKPNADNTDALVFMVLVDGGFEHKEMLDFLYRDRTHLSVYAKAMFGLALHKEKHAEQLDMILQNIKQFLVIDDENQTAYLKLPPDNHWWYWYGSETEAQGYYLKLLAKTDPKGPVASGLAKYLINNRKHATYWNSTRDTAVCIEALADFARASGEARPDMTVQVLVDGKAFKEIKINADNLFAFDNRVVLEGNQLSDGQHRVEFKKQGNGPLYFNAYLTNFTLEDPITRAGLEIKVGRRFYKLVPVDKKVKDSGARGQVVNRKVEKFERQEIKDGATLKSGDMVEVELEIESKNDYEYIMFEDMKASGFEPVEVRSGYNGNDLGAYMELRDERVCFFVRVLGRGTHSVAYKVRAEIPGKFSALPTRASAMYAPELKANSDEFKVGITD